MILGIAIKTGRFAQVRDFLVSAGWDGSSIVQITHENDAAAVRLYDGLVIHFEGGTRPFFWGHFTSTGILAEIGDLVIEGASFPGEYLPRLLTRLTAIDVRADDDREAFERWRPRKIAAAVLSTQEVDR